MFIGKKQRKIYNLEAKVKNRDNLIQKQEMKIKEYENLFSQMTQTIESNNYNNEKIQLRKIKELVHDYQSNKTSSD